MPPSMPKHNVQPDVTTAKPKSPEEMARMNVPAEMVDPFGLMFGIARVMNDITVSMGDHAEEVKTLEEIRALLHKAYKVAAAWAIKETLEANWPLLAHADP